MSLCDLDNIVPYRLGLCRQAMWASNINADILRSVLLVNVFLGAVGIC